MHVDVPPDETIDVAHVPNVLDLFGPAAEEPQTLDIPAMEETKTPEPSIKAPGKSKAKSNVDKALKIRDSNGVVESTSKDEGSSRSQPSVGKEKRKKVVEEERRQEGPARKKPRTTSLDITSSESRPSIKGKYKASDSQKKSKADGKQRHEEEDETSDIAPQPKAKKQRKGDGTASKRPRQPSRTNSDASTSTSTTASSSKIPATEPSKLVKSKAKDPETSALDAEICGLLIESMATSRASCLPASSLYKSVMQCRPSLKAQRSEKDWMEVFERVLQDGEASRGSGVFGKVESSGKVRSFIDSLCGNKH
jgi:hypothetical protein